MKNAILAIVLSAVILVSGCADDETKKQASEVYQQGMAFLANNAEQEGVSTTESGLQYKVLRQSSGEKPSESDTVTVHYRGTLIDGTEFDSSYARSTASSFPLNRVIPGWTEGLQLMSKGAKYRFFIPPELAYRDRKAGKIQPYSTLIFDVELIDINQ